MISDDPYRTSTQYRLFSYASKEDLLAQRTKTNAQSRAQLPSDATYLSVTEETELIDYYVSRLWDLCRLFRVPSHVRVLAPLPPLSRTKEDELTVGHRNEFPPPLLPTQHTPNNPPQTPHPNNPLPRRKNRKRIHPPRLL
jgi:hypothetical protein